MDNPQPDQIKPLEPQPIQPVMQQPGTAPKTCVWAILSLVLAFFFWPAGLVCGIVALVKISNNPQLKGKGLAIAGIILSVLIIPMTLMFIGAIAYFGVLSPANFIPTKCQFEAGLQCTETPEAVQSEGTIKFPLTNNMGATLTDISVQSTKCTGGSASETTVANGATMIITLTGCDLKSEHIGDDVTITYTSETGMKHNAMGQIYAKVS